MGATVLYMSMSLDGFIAGPNAGPDNGLGDGGERLHDWVLTGAGGGASGPPEVVSSGVNGQIVEEFMATGAVVAGRGTFEPAGGWGGDHHDGVPIFILSREEPGIDISAWPLVSYLDDVETAMGRAKEAAGARTSSSMGPPSPSSRSRPASSTSSSCTSSPSCSAMGVGSSPTWTSSWSAPGCWKASTASTTSVTGSSSERPGAAAIVLRALQQPGGSMSKVWFVTGSSRGLGRALVEVALAAGDRVAATARDPERLHDLLDTYGDAMLPLALDVTDYDAAARVVAQANETFGRIDVVVNNAGYSDLGSFEDTTIESFRTQIDTNFYGAVNVSKAAVPLLREQGAGHLFQVSSLIVRLTGAGLTAYQAAKCAVSGFAVGLAQEMAPFGVKVTAIEPGAMRTDWGGSSMTIPPPSAPYQPTIGPFAEELRAFSGHEPGNTRRVAQVVRDLAGRDDAPVRLLLGSDAVPLAQEAAQELAASDEAWREVGLSV